MLAALIWWLLLQAIGLVALPITLSLLRFLPERGLGFARQVGLLLVGYLFWLLVSLGFLQNTRAGIVFVILVVAGLSGIVWARQRATLLAVWREQRRVWLLGEALFLVAYAAFAVFRAYNPDIAYTEKPMEFAFINGILRSEHFPPSDPWLSGYAISYYYFGYVLVAMLTRLSGLSSAVTFNLAGVTLFAMTVSGAFTLVYDLVLASQQGHGRLKELATAALQRAGVYTGLFGALLVAVMGNLEGVFEWLRTRGWGSDALYRWLDVKNLAAAAPAATWYPNDGWWWWRATRIIHDRDALGNSMEVISEFPFFSFLLGDNHPHVLALPFVLLALALALNLLLGVRARAAAGTQVDVAGSGLWATIANWLTGLGIGSPAETLLYALLLGSLGFLNTWDYPIYLGLLVLVYGVARLPEIGTAGWRWLKEALLLGLGLFVLGIVLYLPFYLSFRSQAGGLGWVGSIKTQPQQYLLMYGTQSVLLLGFLLALVRRHKFQRPNERALPLGGQLIVAGLLLAAGVCIALRWWVAAGLLAFVALTLGLLLWGAQRVAPHDAGKPAEAFDEPTLFVLAMLVVGLLLTASVEFVFLRDTFGTRMNTVFKFYYQGWLLLSLAAAYGVFYVFSGARRDRIGPSLARGVWAGLGVIAILAGLSYTLGAMFSKAGGFAGVPTLNGTRYVEQQRPDEYAAVQWLNANALPGTVLAEATGGSYTDYDWVAAHTGIPTLLGWTGHELQWRGNYDIPAQREPVLAAIYQDPQPQALLAALELSGVQYVYLGPLEQAQYHPSSAVEQNLDDTLYRVFTSPSVTIYAVRR